MLKETIIKDYEKARKEFMSDKTSEKGNKKVILGLLVDAIQKKEKADLKVLSEVETIEVVMKSKKDLNESITELKRKNGGEEKIKIAEFQIGIVEEYLPKLMTEDEIRNFIKPIIEENGFSTRKDMGKVMGIVVPQLTGKAEKSIISKVVQTLLA